MRRVRGRNLEKVRFGLHGNVKENERETLLFSQSLAGLRGLAASIVVVYHAMLIFRVGDADDPHRLPVATAEPTLLVVHLLIDVLFNGAAAVVLFFVLSGTVLAMSMDRTGSHLRDLPSYFVRRASRLFPLLVVVTLASAAMHLYYFQPQDLPATTSWMGNYFAHEPEMREILGNALGASNSLNSPAWTIRVELIASALFPALYVLAGRRAFVLGTLVLLTVLAFMPPLSYRFHYFHMFLISFFVGALIPRHGAAIAQRFDRLPGIARVALCAVLVGTALAFRRLVSPHNHVDPLSVLVMTAAAAFVVAVVLHGRSGRMLEAPVFVRLGDISYGVYLIHFAVLFALAHALAPALPPMMTPTQALAANLALAVATLAITIPLAILTYRLVERPCQDLGRRGAKKVSQVGGDLLVLQRVRRAVGRSPTR